MPTFVHLLGNLMKPYGPQGGNNDGGGGGWGFTLKREYTCEAREGTQGQQRICGKCNFQLFSISTERLQVQTTCITEWVHKYQQGAPGYRHRARRVYTGTEWLQVGDAPGACRRRCSHVIQLPNTGGKHYDTHLLYDFMNVRSPTDKQDVKLSAVRAWQSITSEEEPAGVQIFDT